MAKHCISLGAALLGINALGLGQVRFSFELCCPFQYLKHLYGCFRLCLFGSGCMYYYLIASCVVQGYPRKVSRRRTSPGAPLGMNGTVLGQVRFFDLNLRLAQSSIALLEK